MAMTKKEKAEFDAAILEARTLAALRWTERVEPDVPPPDSHSNLKSGFLYDAHSQEVKPACTSSVGHSFGRADKTTTQNPRHLYSTMLRALQAMRNEVEMRAARELLRIDKMIAEERDFMG